MSNKNIIQTPSHLSLFDKNPYNNNSIDYRDGIFKTCERSKLEKQYFNIKNINYLLNSISSELENRYKINKDILTLVMTNIYTKYYFITNLNDMNNKMLTDGIYEIKSLLVSNNIYINDKTNIYTLMDRPIITSNKIEKQLPKFSY